MNFNMDEAKGFFTKYKLPVLLILGAILLIIVFNVAGAVFFPPQTAKQMTLEEAATPNGAKAVLDAAEVVTTWYQDEEVALGIKEAHNSKPDAVVATNAKNYLTVADKLRAAAGGDAVVVVDPNNPSKLPPKVGDTITTTTTPASTSTAAPGAAAATNPTTSPGTTAVTTTKTITDETPIVLDAYIIKAYPKTLDTIAVDQASAMLMHQVQVKVPKIPLLLPKGDVAYVGVYDRWDYKHKENFVGIALTITN